MQRLPPLASDEGAICGTLCQARSGGRGATGSRQPAFWPQARRRWNAGGGRRATATWAADRGPPIFSGLEIALAGGIGCGRAVGRGHVLGAAMVTMVTTVTAVTADGSSHHGSCPWAMDVGCWMLDAGCRIHGGDAAEGSARTQRRGDGCWASTASAAGALAASHVGLQLSCWLGPRLARALGSWATAQCEQSSSACKQASKQATSSGGRMGTAGGGHGGHGKHVASRTPSRTLARTQHGRRAQVWFLQ